MKRVGGLLLVVLLVPIQLDRANRTDARQGMMFLADSAVAVAAVAVDSAPTGDMVAVARGGKRGPLCDPPVRLPGIEPRCARGPRGPGGVHRPGQSPHHPES